MTYQRMVKRNGERNIYAFECAGCGCEGELGVPPGYQDLGCPENCGARYLQVDLGSGPTLVCVVAPVFADAQPVPAEATEGE